SNINDIVCDFFLGSFSTAKVAIGLNRNACGFELNENVYNYQIKEVNRIQKGSLLYRVKQPEQMSLFNQGQKWSENDKSNLINKYLLIKQKNNKSKKEIIKDLSLELGRGIFSITNILKRENL
ncbi:MAG TPA: DNA methyltransferase, partial [bacterium]|nr:DNA methyltransferase [bacterium]